MLAKGRDALAWERLVTLYAPLVYSWCRRAGLQPADAADVGQEVFCAVARALPDFRRERPGDTFRGWLKGITRHKLGDFARRAQNSPQAAGGSDAQREWLLLPAEESDEDGAAADQQTLHRRALELIRGEFAVKHWQAFWLAAVEGRQAADVADALGMTANAVYIAKYRILTRLREEFAGLLDIHGEGPAPKAPP